MKGMDEHRLGAQEDRRGPPQDQTGGRGGEGGKSPVGPGGEVVPYPLIGGAHMPHC